METGQKPIQKSNKSSNNNKLSIQVSLNGFSFCILDDSKKEITHFQENIFDKKQTPSQVLDQLKESLNTSSQLQAEFDELVVIHENELATLVPLPLFDQDHLADYLKFNSRILQTDFITFDTIESINSANVYVPYVNINNYLYDQFGEFKYQHSSTILITSLIAHSKVNNGMSFYVHVGINHFEIIIIENNQLLLYNSFDYRTKEDFIYYILFTAEQLQLDPESQKVVLLGNIDKDGALFGMVFKYIRHVEILDNISPYLLENEKDITASNFIQYNSF